MRTLGFSAILFFLSLSVTAQKASYSFCVKSSEFESFKATLVFESVDFGAQSARLVLQQTLETKLKTKLSLSPFISSSACGCAEGECPEVELQASKINGVFQTRYQTKANGSAATIGTLDRVVSETKKIIDDPKEALKEAVKQGIALLDKFFD